MDDISFVKWIGENLLPTTSLRSLLTSQLKKTANDWSQWAQIPLMATMMKPFQRHCHAPPGKGRLNLPNATHLTLGQLILMTQNWLVNHVTLFCGTCYWLLPLSQNDMCPHREDFRHWARYKRLKLKFLRIKVVIKNTLDTATSGGVPEYWVFSILSIILTTTWTMVSGLQSCQNKKWGQSFWDEGSTIQNYGML